MKISLSILTLIFAAYAVANPSTPELPATNIEHAEAQNTSSPIEIFRGGFASYEKQIKTFIANMQETFGKTDTDNTNFINELRKYEKKLQLPRNKTRSFAVRYRSRCYCEGQYWSPCPARCMDSCYYYWASRWIYSKNCTAESGIRFCYCYEGSSKRCNDGQIDNCYQYKTVEKRIDQPCIEFAPDWTILENTYLRFSELTIKPYKTIPRVLESRLAHLKQVVEANDILQVLTLQTCDGRGTTPCLVEATALLTKRMAYLKQLQLNMTLEMIASQDEAKRVSENLNNLRDRTLNQMHQSIKSYACCMKGPHFNGTDNDCNSATAVTELTSDSSEIDQMIRHPPTPRGDFRCSNIKWIPDSYVCDGEDDCDNDFDEANC